MRAAFSSQPLRALRYHPRMASSLRIENGLLCVPVGTRIPKVCLLCGATKGIVRRNQTYTVGSGGVAVGGVGGVLGAVFAQSMRGLDRGTVALAFAVLIGGGGAIAYLVDRFAKKVEVALPLCEACDGRWAEGVEKRRIVLAGLALFGVLVVVGYVIESVLTVGVGFGILAVLLLFAWSAGLRDRFVQVGSVKTDVVAFRISEETAQKVVARAERKAARKDRGSTGEDAEADA